MDSLTFDGYTSYSDASTPRTPSPTDMHFAAHHHKHDIDQQPIRGTAIFTGGNDDTAPDAHYWQAGGNAFFANSNGSRGSLLQDVYEHDTAEFHTPQEQAFQGQQGADWDPHGNGQHRPGDFAMMRRATFPYVRHDREDGGMPIQQYPPFMQQQQQQQQMLHQQTDNMLYSSRQDSGYPGESFISSSPHSSYNEFDDGAHSIKLEDSSSQIMVPSQTTNGGAQPGFYHRPHSNSSAGIAGHPHGHPHAHQHPHHQHHQQQHQLAHHNPHMTLSYLSPHTGLPVQHTDDAASKETQYLRRRCFNCHTTEPPSWRRSTLNPGKIVCNKCGLYERTHLRPRPLRFDELRAGNKARKASKGTAAAAGNGGVSPKQSKMLVKKEPREYGGGSLVRRSSVSSNSSVHSSSGASDWDDNVSIYSSGSAPPTSFNSPITNNFPLSRDSQSPPRDGGIRLPNNPLSDIASMHLGGAGGSSSTTPLLPPSVVPRKAHSSPGVFYSPSLNASPMPSVAENAVWSAEPEDVLTAGLGSLEGSANGKGSGANSLAASPSSM